MIENNNFNTLKKFLIFLGFENKKKTDKEILWKHPTKLIYFHINSNKKNLPKSSIKTFLKIVKDNYTQKELQELLKPILRQNKIRFSKKNNDKKILLIEEVNKQILETRILLDLLPEKMKLSYFDYKTPIVFSKKLEKHIKEKFVKNIDEEIRISSNLKKI